MKDRIYPGANVAVANPLASGGSVGIVDEPGVGGGRSVGWLLLMSSTAVVACGVVPVTPLVPVPGRVTGCGCPGRSGNRAIRSGFAVLIPGDAPYGRRTVAYPTNRRAPLWMCQPEALVGSEPADPSG